MAKPPPSAGPAAGSRLLGTRLKTAKGRTTASQSWLTRQLNDPYVIAAKADGLRSRAAYKITGLDDRFKLFKPGLRVVDLGAAPGGWTQIAVARTGDTGRVVALDILHMEPVPGATVLKGDFEDAATEAAVREAMKGPADLVLSDMAPNTTGHTATDHLRIIGLVELALHFAEQVLAPGGAFVAKVFAGGTEAALLARMKQSFAEVKHAKPPASRKDSAEMFVVARGFRGRA